MFLAYARVSTREQEDGTSPEEQERKLRAVAALRDPDPFAVEYYYDGGVSGSIPLDDRPAGRKMLFEAKKGDTIIATKLDRLFRSASDALNTTKKLASRGIGLILIDMGLDPVASSGTGKLFFGILALMAEFERERINERLLDGRGAKRKKSGYVGGATPFGWQKIGEGKEAKLIPDREEQDIARLASDLSKDHRLLYRTTKALNEIGVRSRAGKPLLVQQVRAILKSADQLEAIH